MGMRTLAEGVETQGVREARSAEGWQTGQQAGPACASFPWCVPADNI
jgi:hypothetical protein